MRSISILAISALTFLLANQSIGQQVEWVKQIENSGGEFHHSSWAYDVCSDEDGNVYTLGTFKGTFDFDPGAGVSELTSVNTDLFLMKMDTDGKFAWVQHMETEKGSKGSRPTSVAVDKDGGVYAAGNYTNHLAIQTIESDVLLKEDIGESGSKGLTNAFLIKFDRNGIYEWSKGIGSTGYDECTDMEIDRNDNIRMIGKFEHKVNFNPNGVEKTLETAVGKTGSYFASYNLNGEFMAAGHLSDGSSGSVPKSFSSDEAGNSYLIGDFSGSMEYKLPTGGKTFSTEEGAANIYITKVDRRGRVMWVKFIEGEAYNKGKSIVANSEGTVYVNGYFSKSINATGILGEKSATAIGKRDVFIAKFNMDGDPEWIRTIVSDAYGDVSAIALDPTENVFIAGHFNGMITPENHDPIQSAGNSDAYILRYTRNGDIMWSQQLKGTQNVYLNSIFVDDMRKIHVVGAFMGQVDFGVSTLDSHLMNKNFPAGDAYILRMK
jgi:hypothetical protein